MNTRVSVLGAGPVAQVMVRLLAHVAPLRIWGDDLDAPRASRDFPGSRYCHSVVEAARDASLVVLTMSVRRLRRVASLMGEVATGDQVVLLCARGVESGFVLPHQVLRQETCVRKIGVLGGPLQDKDVMAGHPAALVVASRFAEVAAHVQQCAGSAAIIYPSRDVVGVQVASALANVTAIAIGMATGLGMGDTVRGVLLTRGLGEASRLGRALGAEWSTFTGLAGVGALLSQQGVVTARHMELGRYLAEGLGAAAARERVGRDVEGLVAAREAMALANEYGLDLPLVQAVDGVAQGYVQVAAALQTVLQRRLDFEGRA